MQRQKRRNPFSLQERLAIPNARFSIDETTGVLNEGRTKIYERIGAGQLEVVKDGRRAHVTGRSILRILNGEAAQ